MDIGIRLREERERLGMTQESFGQAGGVLKRALIRYEKGERAPDATFLAALAAAGADVLYVLTGERSAVLTEATRRAHGSARRQDLARAGGYSGIESAGQAGSIDEFPAYDSGDHPAFVQGISEAEQQLLNIYRGANNQGREAILLAAAGIASGLGKVENR